MGYATIPDLTTYGLPATSLGNLTTAQQQAALDNASTFADSFLRARYALPLVAPIPFEIVEAVCKIAAYNLMSIRGYNPAAGADTNLKFRHDDAVAWLGKVQRQAAHPNVVQSAALTPAFKQPRLVSSSVVDANGNSGANRGW